MSSARRGFGQHSPGKLVGASMASNIYHPLPAFYFILVAVIWCSASVTRRFADRSYFAFRTSVLAFSLTDCVWGVRDLRTDRRAACRAASAVRHLFLHAGPVGRDPRSLSGSELPSR